MNNPRYRNEDLPTSYNHEFHAGNIGDVWKHLIWIRLIQEMQCRHERIRITDTHAGQGLYTLKPTGEWTEGVGRIGKEGSCEALRQYISCLESLGFEKQPRVYPGSPILCASLLREGDSLSCFEIDESAFEALRSNLGNKGRAVHGDGPAAMRERALKRDFNESDLILIDPPFAAKREWLEMPALLKESFLSFTGITMALWYPIKSYTRINEMHRTLREAKVPVLVLELITTPLHYQRNRLNGSGVLIVNPPQYFGSSIGEAAPFLAERAAIMKHEWEFKIASLA